MVPGLVIGAAFVAGLVVLVLMVRASGKRGKADSDSAAGRSKRGARSKDSGDAPLMLATGSDTSPSGKKSGSGHDGPASAPDRADAPAGGKGAGDHGGDAGDGGGGDGGGGGGGGGD